MVLFDGRRGSQQRLEFRMELFEFRLDNELAVWRGEIITIIFVMVIFGFIEFVEPTYFRHNPPSSRI